MKNFMTFLIGTIIGATLIILILDLPVLFLP